MLTTLNTWRIGSRGDGERRLGLGFAPKVSVVVLAVLGPLILTFCGGDPPGGTSLSCGEGTVQRGTECVASGGGGGGEGGGAPAPQPPVVRCGPGTEPVAGVCVPVDDPGFGGIIDTDAGLYDGDIGSGEGPVVPPPECINAPTEALSAGSCVVVNDVNVTCNPVTNAGCNAEAGERCDYDPSDGLIRCSTGDGVVGSCEPCTPGAPPSCAPGFTCFGGLNACQRFCCDDADCGEGVQCVQLGVSFGICQLFF